MKQVSNVNKSATKWKSEGAVLILVLILLFSKLYPCILRACVNFNVSLFFLVFSFVLKATYHFRPINNYLCIFSRNFLVTKNSHTIMWICKRLEYIFATFCKIFIHIKICLVHIIYSQLCVNFFLLELL